MASTTGVGEADAACIWGAAQIGIHSGRDWRNQRSQTLWSVELIWEGSQALVNYTIWVSSEWMTMLADLFPERT